MGISHIIVRACRLAAAISGFLCLFFLPGCAPESPAPPIRISASYWIGYEPLFVAESMNFFPEGSVHVVENIDAITLEQTMRGDTIDAITVSLSRAINYAEKNHDVTIILVLGWSSGADKILARPSIKDVSDLKGKRVGSEPNTVNSYLLLRALQKHGLTMSDIEMVPLPNEGMEQHFDSQKLDAISAYGRAAIAIEKQGAITLFDSSQIPGEVMDVLLVRTPFLRAYPDRVADLIEGWLLAVEYLESAPANFAPFLVDDEDFAQNAPFVHFASATDNEQFLSDDWAKLRELIQRRREADAILGNTGTRGQLPDLDNKPFLSVFPDMRPPAK